jgi:mono/diheme cytochrome c family protein
MTTPQKKSKKLRLALFVLALALIGLSIYLAVFWRGPWIVPAEEKARKNPLTATDANLAAAQETYSNKCEDCHGSKGKGDGDEAMMYDPAPSDLTNKTAISQRTDGEIFYQITEGRKPMPSFKKKLTDEQRWQLVLLVRAFANGTAPAPKAAPASTEPEPPAKAN